MTCACSVQVYTKNLREFCFIPDLLQATEETLSGLSMCVKDRLSDVFQLADWGSGSTRAGAGWRTAGWLRDCDV